jgi:hypothetical protein
LGLPRAAAWGVLYRRSRAAAFAHPADALCERWLENPHYQLFCGEEFFRHALPFDRSSMTRWRQRMGQEKLVALLQENLHLATRTGAAKPADFAKVIVDTTVKPKAISFPTDARLLYHIRPARGWSGWHRSMVSGCGNPTGGWAAGADPPPALRPCQAVQTCQSQPAQFAQAA